MAHIPDGVLSVPVLVGGGVVTAASLGYALKSLDEDRLPRVAVLAALFFVASLISVAVGPTSVHLLLSGLMGLVIGWAAVPAVFVGLVMQAVFFGFGGLTTLGVNTMNIALPGVLWAVLFGPLLVDATPRRAAWVGAVVAALSVASTALMVALALTLSDTSYMLSARIVLLSYGPLLVGEAIITGFACGFLARVSPDMLAARAMRRGGRIAVSS
ncbi:cobalt transporter CbiM [Kaistia nematophila]|uniref:Cobalt transporter CbiM n=1 Tax=Kaistia nematophila TaxID=2994654 RepID=A0A9X3E596_9HYPH|nr:cobalt transporter CbiM [Kaistia nematophila]MCX5572081.1 cobalt transporter CbiM [Kaistia nematophila]